MKIKFFYVLSIGKNDFFKYFFIKNGDNLIFFCLFFYRYLNYIINLV